MYQEFENFELRLRELKEKSAESYDMAEKLFSQKYEAFLAQIFPRDFL